MPWAGTPWMSCWHNTMDFELFTDDTLAVKTLRPVGSAYDKEARFLQGIAMYQMHYGFWITAIASAKMAWKKKELTVFTDNLLGYFKARKGQMPYLVTHEEGALSAGYAGGTS